MKKMWNWSNLKQHGWDGQCHPFCRDERGPNQRRFCSWVHDPQLQVCHGLLFSLLLLSQPLAVFPKLGPSRLSSYTLPHLPSQSPLSKITKKNSLKFWFQNSGCFFVVFAFWLLHLFGSNDMYECVTVGFCFCVVLCDMCSSRQRICALKTWNCLRVQYGQVSIKSTKGQTFPMGSHFISVSFGSVVCLLFET